MPIEKLRPSFSFDEERIKQLKQIAPEAFADNQVNWEVLKEALGNYLEEDELDVEHFGLFWPGKREARRMASIPSKGTLVPCPGEGIDEENTRNIFIEGENLEVLKILQKSYAGRIKMIYIDPPYNTGNDFVYDDDFTEPLEEYLRRTGQIDEEGKPLTTNKKSDGRFHSKWLSMMYPRLRLARNLLCDDGFLICHIDENEINNLSHLLNEIFGEENNVGTIIWNKKNPKGDARGIAAQHESLLCYIKNKEYLVEKSLIQRPKKNAERILKKASELFSKIGKKELPIEVMEICRKYKIDEKLFTNFIVKFNLEICNKEFSDWIKNQEFSGGEIAYSKIDENGDVYQSVSMAWPNKKRAPDDYFIPLVHPRTKKECPIPERGWRFPSKSLKDLLEKNEIIFGKDENTQPRRKYLLKENMFENIPSIIDYGGSDDKLFTEWKIPFDNPKPYKLSAELIKYFTKPGDIILDFFAGSGTVGHSVFELNKSDDERYFILVQLDELTEDKSIEKKMKYDRISDITFERLKLASESYTQLEQKYGFKKLKLLHSNYKQWSEFNSDDTRALENIFSSLESSLIENWKKENLLNEVILIEGFPLDSNIEELKEYKKNIIQQVTSDFCEHILLICLDEKVHSETIKILQLSDNDIFICLDNAITDEEKVTLSDKGLIKTI